MQFQFSVLNNWLTTPNSLFGDFGLFPLSFRWKHVAHALTT